MLNSINWQSSHAAIWRGYSSELKVVQDLDPINLEQLIGINKQKKLLCANTISLLNGKSTNHALLWGARGCGKSSLVKAVFNRYRSKMLRLIQIDSADLAVLPAVIDTIRASKYKFIIFCDDLSLPQPEAIRALKILLEGSIELAPQNIVLYATSNRRHLLAEPQHENDQISNEIHPNDAIEERISLADRFGLTLSFYPFDNKTFMHVVEKQLSSIGKDKKHILNEARKFALHRGICSGRTIKQFKNYYQSVFGQQPTKIN